MRVLYLLILTVLMLLPAQAAVADKAPGLESYSFVTEGFVQTSAYKTYMKKKHKDLAEIRYLINLIKESPYMFKRNGKVTKGKHAARFLWLKAKHHRNEIETTEDFIERVGSHSRTSGYEYFMINGEGEKIPLKEIYYNELNRLRNN